MEWTKIPTDILQSRFSDKEILAIVKYQMLWAMLERQPTDEICLRYMTEKQLQQVRDYTAAIQRRVSADIKSIESHRNRQKIYYTKNQTLKEKTDGHTDGHTDGQADGQADATDKIRLDNIYNTPLTPLGDESEKFDQFWEAYQPVSGKDGTCVAKGSKSRCKEKYFKIVKKTQPEKIIDGLKKYLDYCQENRICSCGAEVFLNQRRWENEYQTKENDYGYNPRL